MALYQSFIGIQAYCINTKMIAMTASTRTRLTIDRRLPPLARILHGLTLVVLRWEERRRTRRDLRDLDDHLLRDVGIPPDVAWGEGQKHFWQV
jgi:uncharacterized protein YjiS (DUF1127 family)